MIDDRDALLDLAGDLETRKGPALMTDCQIAKAAGWRYAELKGYGPSFHAWIAPDGVENRHADAGRVIAYHDYPPRYSASVDDALSLMRWLLPGYICTCSTYGFASKMAIADIYREGHVGRICVKASSLPLAICAAVLRTAAAGGSQDAAQTPSRK